MLVGWLAGGYELDRTGWIIGIFLLFLLSGLVNKESILTGLTVINNFFDRCGHIVYKKMYCVKIELKLKWNYRTAIVRFDSLASWLNAIKIRFWTYIIGENVGNIFSSEFYTTDLLITKQIYLLSTTFQECEKIIAHPLQKVKYAIL